MIKKADSFVPEIRGNMRGGDGEVQINNFLTASEMYDKGRLFGTITLEPGCSIGYHVHTGDSEIFYVLEGTAVYNDNGEDKTVCAGDVLICPEGTGHAVANRSDKTVKLMALIVYA